MADVTQPLPGMVVTLDRTGLRAATRDVPATRFGLERTLDLALWLDMYKPVLTLS